MIDVKPYLQQMVADRRHFHHRPELGWCEFETTAYIVDRLESLGIFHIDMGRTVINPDAVLGRNETSVGEAMKRALAQGVSQQLLDQLGGYTGVIATWDSGRPGKTVAIRFDMDALPITESQDKSHLPMAEGFASAIPGCMHACGHDGHSAIGLAVAAWIKDHQKTLNGKIKIVFQPAEEGVRGAAAIAASGKLDDVDVFLASHVGTEARPGEVKVLQSGFLATTKYDITFEGRSSHAGCEPEKGRSALSAACACVLALQGIPRHSQGDTRIAVGTLHAGEGRNVVPAKAVMQIEVRGATTEVNHYMAEEACRLIEGISAGYGVKPTITKMGDAAVFEADEDCIKTLMEAARAVPEVEHVTEFTTTSGSEDASLLAKRVRDHGGKAGFFIFGCDHHGHHRPDFDIQDTQSLPVGFAVMTGALMRYLGA
ncbi:peptidase, M20D family [gut metagenome]|uniref:Peptidase, M20D family n=1 Tax=gut metagenome TaxID=749906 RepID=J9GBA8_9ZZZZ